VAAVFAVLLVALSLVAAAVGASLRRPGWARWRRLRVVTAGLVGLWFLAVLSSVAGAILPDALGDVPASIRPRASDAVHGGIGCGSDWPLTRVTRVRVSAGGGEVSWTCAWSIWGVPAVRGRASCVGGTWLGSGYLDPRTYGVC
jgi:hypothetical protein